MSGNEPGRPDLLPEIGDRCSSRMDAAASCWLGDVAFDNAMANSCTGDLGGICGGWHLSGVCMYVFLVIGTARGAAGRAFPAMLRARALYSVQESQVPVFSYFYWSGGREKKQCGSQPFFSTRGSLFLCGSSFRTGVSGLYSSESSVNLHS